MNRMQTGVSAVKIPATLAEAERSAIENALIAAQGNKSRAARFLGIHRSLLYEKLKRHQIEIAVDVRTRQ